MKALEDEERIHITLSFEPTSYRNTHRSRTLDLYAGKSESWIENMVCEHSLMYSRGALGFLDYTEQEREMFKPVRQRLVRTHPSTGAN